MHSSSLSKHGTYISPIAISKPISYRSDYNKPLKATANISRDPVQAADIWARFPLPITDHFGLSLETDICL